MARRLVLAAASLSALALLAAGCGGGGGDTKGTTAWAGDLCAAITAWQSSLSDSVRSIRGTALTRPAIRNVADDAKSSTDAFIDELGRLGVPDTQAGTEAKDLVDQLAADLRRGIDEIESALDGSSTTAGVITSVTNTLTSMGNQLTSTLTQLGQLDPQGEIQHGFEQADTCKTLVS